MDNDLLITVPILQGFDPDKIIGSVQILKSKLPDTPNFSFSLGYRILEIDSDNNITKYELVTVSPVLDTYLAKTKN